MEQTAQKPDNKKQTAPIKIRCIYCGRRLALKPSAIGKKGRCPKCRHTFTITEYICKKFSADKPLPPDKLMKAILDLENQDQRDLGRGFLQKLLPSYDEVTLLSMAVLSVLVLLKNPLLVESSANNLIAFILDSPFVPLRKVLLIAAIPGLALSLYHVLTERFKSSIEKLLMLIFAVSVNILAATAIVTYMLQAAGDKVTWPYFILILWNSYNGITLLILLRTGMLHIDCISDENAKPLQAISTLILSIGIFSLSSFLFKMHDAVAFSMTICYVTSFDQAVRSMLGMEQD